MDMTVKMFQKIFMLMVFLQLKCNGQQQYPRVETKLGTIIGNERTSETGKKIYSFPGIPYIKPPVKELRFKPPVPVEPFQKEFNATNEWATCAQNISGMYYGSEDCVVLNVFTPWNPSSPAPAKPLSVMVFIHFGAFIGGSANKFAVGLPDYLLEHDVVLVTVNHRLGVFGFLSTGDEEAPGNYGLLDLVEALKWINKNIAAFAGNPNKVTVFGQNSGAVITHYLMLSPLTKGLLHRVIVQSGSALAPWGRTNLSKRYSKILAEKLGCPTSSSSQLLDCLRGKTTEELVKTDVIDKDERYSEYLPLVWGPRIDRESDHPFLPEHPFDIIMSGDYNKVPLLIGNTKDEFASEMLGPVKNKYGSEDLHDPQMKSVFMDMCALSMGFLDMRMPKGEATDLCNKVMDHYENENEDGNFDPVVVSNDIGMLAGIYKSIELMSNETSVYSYSFNYENGRFWFTQLFDQRYKSTKGYVTHMDDLLYLFKYPKTNWTTSSPEYQMVQMMTKAWTDFAKTGIPVLPKLNEPWPRATPRNSKYVVIDTKPSIEENYREDDIDFINNIFSETLYKEPYETNRAAPDRKYFNCVVILAIILNLTVFI